MCGSLNRKSMSVAWNFKIGLHHIDCTIPLVNVSLDLFALQRYQEIS